MVGCHGSLHKPRLLQGDLPRGLVAMGQGASWRRAAVRSRRLSLPLFWQGGPGQDDLQHHVHQGEPSPLPTSAWCVPAAQQTHHLPRRTHLARRSVNPIPASRNRSLGQQPRPHCLPQTKGDSPASVTRSSLTQVLREAWADVGILLID